MISATQARSRRKGLWHQATSEIRPTPSNASSQAFGTRRTVPLLPRMLKGAEDVKAGFPMEISQCVNKEAFRDVPCSFRECQSRH